MLCEANCFLAGAAWSALRCYAYRLLAAGRHRWAALVARGVVGLGHTCMARWDRLGTLRFTVTVYGRRSRSNLRRPPQEVAASLN